MNAVEEASFMGKLRAKTGRLFDLPTEAQWEYACRAGTTTVYSYGDRPDGDYAWCSETAGGQKTHEVGITLPNPWGLYDMHGNVWEWCLDWNGTLAYGTDPKGSASGTARIFRGGSWYDSISNCTSHIRGSTLPVNASFHRGFRISWTLQNGASTDVTTSIGGVVASGSAMFGTSGVDATQTTAVPVPFAWLREKYPELKEVAAFEAKAANGVNTVMEAYVAGFDPRDEQGEFQALIQMVDGKPVVTWRPVLPEAEAAKRVYTTYGKESMDGSWVDLSKQNDAAKAKCRFFKVGIWMK